MGENESMNQGKNSRVPFWRPWGMVGYMWRFLLFWEVLLDSVFFCGTNGLQ